MEKKKTETLDFSRIDNTEDMKTYLTEHTWGHKELFHYTDLRAIDTVLSTGEFRISSVDRLNDENEKEAFSKNRRSSTFAVCFSSGKNENLSLWYMYSGIDGKGGRLRFTKGAMRDFVEKCTYTLCEYDYDTKAAGKSIVLIPGETMKQTFLDVLYFKENGKAVNLKYNTMTNYGRFSVEEFDKYKKKCPGFCKDIVWYYEKEARLLIELKGEALKFIKPDKQYAIFVMLTDSIKKKLSIRLGPEIEEIEDVISPRKNPNIWAQLGNTEKIEKSDSAGKIHMNLKGKMCANCQKCNNCENNLKGKRKL